MSARKIGLLILIVAFGASIETAWNLRGDVRVGPQGCRVVSGRFYGPSYSFEQTAERQVAAAPRLEVTNGFGAVHVAAGAPGIVRVRLRKVVYMPTEDKARAFADRVELRLSGEGSPLRIGTNRDEISRGEDIGFETHLEVEAPADSTVSVRDEHGRVDLSGVAAADVSSSFDGVSVARIAREAKIESRHGDVAASEVGGELDVRSRQGGVELEGITGAAKVDVEHGDVRARRTAALTVSQRYGALTAEAVAGPLVVRARRCEVEAHDVKGDADVETSFGSVRLGRIGGLVRTKVEHGAVTADDVTGGLTAESSYDGVDLTRIGGPVQITVHHGGVVGKGLASGARVRASFGSVELDGFSGPVDVDLDRGSAQLLPQAAIAAPVTVSVANGEARLEIPEGSRVDLDAESRRGDVRADVPGFSASEQQRGRHGRGERVAGRVGGGGSLVKLHADGDVTLGTTAAAAIADRPIAPPELATTTNGARPPAEAAASPTPGARRTPKATPTAAATPKP